MPITQPIRLPFDARSLSYRRGIWLAYPALFILLAGDGVRYTIGWTGFAIVSALFVVAAGVALAVRGSKDLFRRLPISLIAILSFMGLSTIWSQYQLQTFGATILQLATTVVALFFANQFDWRQLLNIFANTIRFILLISFAMELYAAFSGPIKPLFPNFEGDTPPAAAYWWVQGNLFDYERIQGFPGNANLISFIAVLGLVTFFVEYIVTAGKKQIPLASFIAAAVTVALAKSASMTVALLIVFLAALVAILAEGKPKEQRIKIYIRTLWSGVFAVFLTLVYWVEITDLLGKSADASGRFTIWQKVWMLITERPLEGWGWISHWLPGLEPFEGLVVINKVPQYHAHNAFLDVWMQLGVVGLALFIWLLVSTLVRVWKIAVLHTNPLYLWPLFAFMVILTQALTESRLLVEIGWVLLVLLAVKGREPFEELEPVGSSTKLKKLLRTPLRVLGRKA
jgi:O-antigen ligase